MFRQLLGCQHANLKAKGRLEAAPLLCSSRACDRVAVLLSFLPWLFLWVTVRDLLAHRQAIDELLGSLDTLSEAIQPLPAQDGTVSMLDGVHCRRILQGRVTCTLSMALLQSRPTHPLCVAILLHFCD
jgi:hypothetical protein